MSGHRLVPLSHCLSLGPAHDCPGCGARVIPVTLSPAGAAGRVEWKGRLHEWSWAVWHDQTRCEEIKRR